MFIDMKYNIYYDESKDNSKISILVTTKIISGKTLLDGSLSFDKAIELARNYMSVYQTAVENTLVEIIIR